jgi:hypothetical protein
MRVITKLGLAVSLLASASLVSAANYCPPIKTAINAVAQLTTVSAGAPLTGTVPGFLYSATLADGTKINYYTQTKPTQVDPVTQIKSLAPAFTAGTALPSATNDSTLNCVYLGSMTDVNTPAFTAPWNQVIMIQISGSGPKPPPSGPKINVNVTFAFPAGVTPPATVGYVTLTDDGDNAYTVTNASTAGATITEVPTSTTAAVDYTATADNAIVGSTTYCAGAATASIPANATSFSFQLTYSTDACSVGPTPTPGVSLPGWPKYLAMGNITQSINEFVYTNKAGVPGQYLDANYSYATDGGGGSPGILIGLPDIADSIGKNWYKVFYILHHATSSAGRASPSGIIAVPVYYTTDAGSGGLAGNFINIPGMRNPCPYASCACPQDYDGCTQKDAQGHWVPVQAGLMSPGMLITQYANLINFLALVRNEAMRQNNLTASILFNPDLLGKMYQEGLTDPSVNYWLDYKFNDIQLSLEAAINATTFPNGTTVAIDPDAQKILKANLATIENAIHLKGNEDGRAYLNSISILTKTLLSASNCSVAGVNKCQNITFGWHLNAWLAGGNANNLRTAGAGKKYGTTAANWLVGTGLFTGSYAADFIAFDKYEADGLTSSGISNGYFWNWQTFDEYVDFVSTIAHSISPDPTKPVPVMLWQVPASHIPNVTETTSFPYQIGANPVMAARIDNNTNYFFGNHYIKSPALTALAPTMNISLATIGQAVGATPSHYYGCTSQDVCPSIAQAAGILSNADLVHFTTGHLSNLASAGVFAILWGGGDFTRTTSGFCAFASPIGTDCTSASPPPQIYNNDNGWFAHVMTNYYASPLVIKSVNSTSNK